MKVIRAWPIILIMFMASPAFAQWEYGGKFIGYFSYLSDDMAVANVRDGATVIVWNGISGGDRDILAQCVDSAGYAMWGDYGMIVYEDEGIKQGYPAVLPDGEGGVFLVWSDWRHTWDQGVALYGQRLDSSGNLLWDAEGVRLTADSMSHTKAKLYDDGYGGFVAVYTDSYAGDADVGSQRVSGEGEITWDSTGIKLTGAERDQLIPRTCNAGDSTFITCWIDMRNGSDYDTDIYIQSFDLEGNVLWEADGIPAVHWPFHQSYLDEGHDIVADGQGGAVVVWLDSRNYAYNDILYADRFSQSGQSLWQVNGKKMGSEIFDHADGCQAFRVGDMILFRWSGGNLKFSAHDLDGDRIWQEIRVLDTLVAMENYVFMEPEGIFKYMVGYSQGLFIRAGGKADTSGYQYWPNHPFIANYAYNEQILTDGYEGMIAVWRASNYQIYISRIYADGHVGGDTTTAIFNFDNQLPYALKLWQNYPNPFNTSTTIRFQVDSRTDLSFDIFNILGQMVHTEKHLNYEPGDYSISLNLTGYPSGLYFLKISTKTGFSGNIRITLLK